MSASSKCGQERLCTHGTLHIHVPTHVQRKAVSMVRIRPKSHLPSPLNPVSQTQCELPLPYPHPHSHWTQCPPSAQPPLLTLQTPVVSPPQSRLAAQPPPPGGVGESSRGVLTAHSQSKALAAQRKPGLHRQCCPSATDAFAPQMWSPAPCAAAQYRRGWRAETVAELTSRKRGSHRQVPLLHDDIGGQLTEPQLSAAAGSGAHSPVVTFGVCPSWQ